MRHPAYDPAVCDHWEYTAPDGTVDIEVLEVTPRKVGFRYGTSYLNWTHRSFADICKNWRIVAIAKTAPGGPS